MSLVLAIFQFALEDMGENESGGEIISRLDSASASPRPPIKDFS